MNDDYVEVCPICGAVLSMDEFDWGRCFSCGNRDFEADEFEDEDDIEDEDLDYEYGRWRGDYLDAGM